MKPSVGAEKDGGAFICLAPLFICIVPNLHYKSVTEALLKWHLGPRCFNTDYLMLLRGGLNAFTRQLQLYTFILGAELGLNRHNLV